MTLASPAKMDGGGACGKAVAEMLFLKALDYAGAQAICVHPEANPRICFCIKLDLAGQ
jgi:hypothetical protein